MGIQEKYKEHTIKGEYKGPGYDRDYRLPGVGNYANDVFDYYFEVTTPKGERYTFYLCLKTPLVGLVRDETVIETHAIRRPIDQIKKAIDSGKLYQLVAKRCSYVGELWIVGAGRDWVVSDGDDIITLKPEWAPEQLRDKETADILAWLQTYKGNLPAKEKEILSTWQNRYAL